MLINEYKHATDFIFYFKIIYIFFGQIHLYLVYILGNLKVNVNNKSCNIKHV